MKSNLKILLSRKPVNGVMPDQFPLTGLRRLIQFVTNLAQLPIGSTSVNEKPADQHRNRKKPANAGFKRRNLTEYEPKKNRASRAYRFIWLRTPLCIAFPILLLTSYSMENSLWT
jgi:hypothetical protein